MSALDLRSVTAENTADIVETNRRCIDMAEPEARMEAARFAERCQRRLRTYLRRRPAPR